MCADDLKTYFPELNVPRGITWHDLEVAEQMVFDWEDGSDSRAFGLAIKIYEPLRKAVLAAEKNQSVERLVVHHLDGTHTVHETRCCE
jgi:hypothetical protein